MNSELNGSSYYRANPFYQQGYVPDSALRNRKSPAYLAQIPQGEKYFQPSNRKHFQRVGYYSTIAQQKIINSDNNDQQKSPAREKQFFRSLNINDIEGASTNTLISQAVKNRMKAQEHLMKRSKEHYQEQAIQKVRRFSQMEDKQKREEALQKMKKEKLPNYHELVKRMKTDHSEGGPPITAQQGLKQNKPTYQSKYNPNSNYNELEQTQNQIIELQKKLQKIRAENQKNSIQNFQNQSNKYQRNVLKQQEERYQQMQQKNATIQSYQNNNKPYSRQSNLERQKDSLQNQPKNHPKNNNSQIGYNLQIPQSYTNIPQHADRDRQYSLSDKMISKDNIPNNIYTQQIVKKQEEQIQYDSRLKNKQSRQRHRKYNPTYLSFGSASIGLAGKNIVGF